MDMKNNLFNKLDKIKTFENQELNINLSVVENDDGSISVNLEDVARGLGFTRIANSGNEVIRWERVKKYLHELGVPTSGHEDFIPESVFYLLAMKASNNTANQFQKWVAIDVIPAIRKTGSYNTDKRADIVLNSIIDISKSVIEMTQAVTEIVKSISNDKKNTTSSIEGTNLLIDMPNHQCKLETFPKSLQIEVQAQMEEMVQQEALNYSAIARFCTLRGFQISAPSVKKYYEKNYKRT